MDSDHHSTKAYDYLEDHTLIRNVSDQDKVPVDIKLTFVQLSQICLAVITILVNVILLFSLKKFKGLQRSVKVKTLLSNIALAYIFFAMAIIVNDLTALGKTSCLVKVVMITTSAHVVITCVALQALEVHLVSRRTTPG